MELHAENNFLSHVCRHSAYLGTNVHYVFDSVNIEASLDDQQNAPRIRNRSRGSVVTATTLHTTVFRSTCSVTTTLLCKIFKLICNCDFSTNFTKSFLS
jgi:hypothetical protein